MTGQTSVLSNIACLPERDANDRRTQKTRNVGGKDGRPGMMLKDSILVLFMDKGKKEEQIVDHIKQIILDMTTTQIKDTYHILLQESSPNLQKECNPQNGRFWSCIEYSKDIVRAEEVTSVDDIITSDAAIYIVSQLYNLNSSQIANWPASIRSFASGGY